MRSLPSITSYSSGMILFSPGRIFSTSTFRTDNDPKGDDTGHAQTLGFLVVPFCLRLLCRSCHRRRFSGPAQYGLCRDAPAHGGGGGRGFPGTGGLSGRRFRRRAGRAEPRRDGLGTRGRLWVAENYTYSDSTQRFDLRLRDRVLIFEDADGDGRVDKRTVFTDEVQRLGSVELGLGGVWLLCPPQFLFIPTVMATTWPMARPKS